MKSLLIFIPLIISTLSLNAEDCEVVLYSTHIKVVNDKLIESETILLQVNTRMGENYTQFVLPYNQKNKLNTIEAQIEDLYGNIIRKLKKSEILHVSAVSEASLYTDEFCAIFQPKHNSYPYRIRVSYENEFSEFWRIADWIPIQDDDIPTRKAELILEVPAEYKINYTQEFIDSPTITEINGKKKYTWHTIYDKIIKHEDYSPPLIALLPRVTVLPETFNYTIQGSYTTWGSIGQWFFDLIAGLDELTPVEKYRVSGIISGLTNDKDKVKALYQYLQNNTRYINVSIDIGGLKPYPASYVCQNKYGDCKALTNYMKALLKEAGIRSYYSLIYADKKIKRVAPDFPNPEFNHVILFVPLKNDTFWLECTNKALPFNYIHSSIQNRYALVIDDHNSRLVKVPQMRSEDITNVRTMNCLIHPDGNAELSLQLKAKGYSFEYLNDFNTSLSDHEKKQQIDNFFGFSRYDLKSWKITQPGHDSAYLFLDAELDVHELAKSYGNEMILKLPPIQLPDFRIPSKRSNPVQIDYPLQVIDSIIVELPAQYKIQSVPAERSISGKYGDYYITSSVTDNKVILYRRYKISPAYYSLTEYPEFYSFIVAIDKTEKENLILINTSAQ